MKHLFSLLLCCLMLTGCAQAAPEAPVLSPAETAPQPSFPELAAVSGHPLEQSAPGALRVYPLETAAQAMLPVGNKLLLLYGGETTVLTLLNRENLQVTAVYPLPFSLDADGMTVGTTTLSCFDPERRETLVLSTRLTEIRRIAAPEGLVGIPLYSDDDNTLYYVTKNAIRAWNLDSGIRRCVREQNYSVQEIVGIHQGGRILQCRVTEGDSVKTLFLSAETGALLQEVSGDAELYAQGNSYFAQIPEGSVKLPVFARGSHAPQVLTPEDIYGSCHYLPEQNRAVWISRDLSLSCYDLNTGRRSHCLTLTGQYQVLSISAQGKDGLWLLLKDIAGDTLLCRWDLTAEISRTKDTAVYTGPRYTREQPDTAGLAQCRAQAQKLEEKYGIGILIGEAPLSVMPWDYEFETEYLAPVLEEALQALDRYLADYPAEIFTGIRAHFTSLNFCLLRRIQGAPASGSVARANGVQFFREGDAYIALAIGEYAQRAVYHEMYHVMETRLLTDSAAFDRWDALNPADFAYDYDYTANAARQDTRYLQPDTRSFIDRYSMSYPKEDRARIMEYAMTEGNGDLFRPPVMQEKLACICRAIRQAYGLKGDTYRWEQYLNETARRTA